MMHVLKLRMDLPVCPRKAFAFVADRSHHERVTPPNLGFSVLTPPPIHCREGTVIDYRLRVFGGPIHWRCRVERREPPHLFVHEQIRDPCKLWRHAHLLGEEPHDVDVRRDRVRVAVQPAGRGGPPVRRQGAPAHLPLPATGRKVGFDWGTS